MSTEPTAAQVAEETSTWLVGGGVITLALFPLALPIVALIAIALLPFLLPVLAVGAVAAAVAVPLRLVRRARARNPRERLLRRLARA